MARPSLAILIAGPTQAQETHNGPYFKGELAAGLLNVDDRDTDLRLQPGGGV